MEETADSTAPINKNDLTFSGSGKEFFGIWIVNFLLTICTFGIYSAWAKVRTTNYFYGNTKLKGSSFSYTANPISILKGRIIAFVVLMAYTFLSQSSPQIGGLIILLIALISPLVIVSSLKFRMYNTEYRGLRFGFIGSTGEAYKIFLGGYLLVVLSLGILFPWWEKKRKEFYVRNIRFGTSQFTCNMEYGTFYKAAGIVFLFTILFIIFMSFFFPLGVNGGDIIGLLFFPLIGILGAYWYSTITNHVISKSNLKNISFRSEMKTGELAMLWLGNIILMVITLGLATPWVMVRNARYRISKTSVIGENLDTFIANNENKVSSMGDEIGEALDIDLAI